MTATTGLTAPDPRRWPAFTILLLAAFMDLLDGTIVFVALPRIASDLDADYAAMQWVVAGYTLAFAVGLITGGRLGDIYGRRTVFLAGVVGFTTTSVIAGLAPTVEILIAARIAQGLAAAIMVPQVLSIGQVLFDAKERYAAFALYGITLSLAAVVGPLLGAVLTEADIAGLDWRPIFLINLPIGIVTFAAGLRYVPESRSPRPLRLDLIGVGLVTTTLLLIMVPLVEGRTLGWPTWTLVALGAAAPALLAFAAWERHKARRDGSPLVEPSLFARRPFDAGLLLSLLFMAGLGSFWLVLVLYLQVGLGFSPITTALAGIAWPASVMIVGGLGAKLADSVGRPLIVVGLGLMAVGVAGVIATVTLVGPIIEPWQLAPALAVGGAGMGIAMPGLFDTILAGVPTRDAGSASGVVNTVMQVGSALGIAIVGVIFFGLVPGTEAAGSSTGGPSTQVLAETFASALTRTLWFHVGAFGVASLLGFLLPRRAIVNDEAAAWEADARPA
jgi:EmrB/QacA subfamily drug resistance transporter